MDALGVISDAGAIVFFLGSVPLLYADAFTRGFYRRVIETYERANDEEKQFLGEP